MERDGKRLVHPGRGDGPMGGGRRLEETGRIGKSWGEMEGGGKRWEEMERDGKRYEEDEGKVRKRKEIERVEGSGRRFRISSEHFPSLPISFHLFLSSFNIA